MSELIEFFKTLMSPEKVIAWGGFTALIIIIFAETGLLIGFFLPGDSLLLTAGLLVTQDILKVDIVVLNVTLMLAAIIGDTVGYWFGRKTGPVLYHRKDTFFFKKKYLKAAELYYNKQGAFALIMGRFVPIVRTFAPIIAGVVRLEFKKFALYNICGAFLWITSLTLLGYFLGRRFEKEINDYLLYIIIGFITITTIPVIYTFLKKRAENNNDDITNTEK